MLKILDAKIEDVDNIYNLLDKNFTCEKLSKDSIIDYINNKTLIDYVKVLWIDDEFHGVIIYRINDIAELITICVDENIRRQQYGTYLLKLMFYTIDTFNIELKEKCVDATKYNELSCKKVMLEVRAKNTPAINLYEKEKFTKIDVRKNYYKEPLDDCIVMERKVIC